MTPENQKSKPPLVQAMLDYESLNRRRFHMPGHAGQVLIPNVPGLTPEAYLYDQTEVEGLDVLSEPEGCLAQAQARAAQVFGVAHSFYSVQGSTLGLMAAMLATLKPGDKVLLPRNVHRSIISGLIVCGAEPVWFLPEYLPRWGLWGVVSPAEVASLLDRQPDIKALMLTSPTYEGIGSDIVGLSRVCRERRVLLLVDEAHGSLWPFSDALPESAVTQGADFVTHSLHKSAGSLTQTALAHLPQGSRLDAEAFQQALNTLQTTSPSYLLMASLDATVDWLSTDAARRTISKSHSRTQKLRQNLRERLSNFELYDGQGAEHYDPSRIYLTTPLASGLDWAVRMESERLITYENASPFGGLYLASLGLQDDDYDTFIAAFLAEDPQLQTLQAQSRGNAPKAAPDFHPAALPAPQMAMPPRDAFFAPGVSVELSQSLGRIAKETIAHCPPGVPVLLPGEVIQAEHLPWLRDRSILTVIA